MPLTAPTRTPGLSRRSSKAEAIVVSIPPRDGSGATLERFAAAIAAAPALRRIVYYSTIGVYGDHGGAWVDETSATLTRTARGLARLEDEARWTAAAKARERKRTSCASPASMGRAAMRSSICAGRGAADRQAGPGFQPRPCR